MLKILWLLVLACLISLPGMAMAQPALVAGPGISKQQRATITEALALADKVITRKFGASVKHRVRAFASTDATWLTDSYLEANALDGNYRSGKMKEFGACEPAAEGGYYVMFLCLKDPVWSRKADSMGVVAHEYTHNLQFDLLGARGKGCCKDSDAMSVFGPQWMVEGSAEYINLTVKAQLGALDFNATMKKLARSIPRSNVSLSARESRKGYRELPNSWEMGVVAVHRLAQTSGLPAFVSYWKLLGAGTFYDTAFTKAFGRTIDEFEVEFADSLR
jgi:hypothetical protein